MSGRPNLSIKGDWLTAEVYIRNSDSLKTFIENMEKTTEWKNNDIRKGNKELEDRVRAFIITRQDMIKREHEEFHSIIERIGIPLKIRKDEASPVVNFDAKEELVPLIKPEPKKSRELFLQGSQVATVVEYIRNSSLSFEKTPVVFSELKEEALRDIIIGNINAIFKGDATGETFSKLGKTDISLKLPEGNILVIECKNWDGKQKYIDGIDQLFRYLTWRENFGVLISFVKISGFTEIIHKAKEATQEHMTFVKGSLIERGTSEYATQHRFPEDAQKKLELHHLLFNLYVG